VELCFYDFHETKMTFLLPGKHDNKNVYNFMCWSSDWLYI